MQPPISTLLDQLKSSDPVAREAAIPALGESRYPAVANPLKQVQASDPDPKLRDLAGRYVQQIPIQLTQSPTPGFAAAVTPTAPANKSGVKPSGKPGENVFQMLWDCRFCGTKKLLAVDMRHCPNCGAAQDPQWRYFPSEADKKAISDPNYTYAGVDKICPFCGQPNSAAAKFCKDCGGDLTNAKAAALHDNLVTGIGEDAPGVVEDVALKNAQRQQAAIKAANKPRGLSRTQIILLGIAAVVIGIGAVIGFLALSKHAASFNVSNLSWQRTINIEQYEALPGSNWQDSVPIGAYNRTCYAKDRPHEETYTESCGVQRVDNGDGSYSEREKTCTRSRTVYVPDTYCNYTVNSWVSIAPMQMSGGPSDPLVWPNFVSAQNTIIGAQRESSRNQILNVMFADTKTKRTYTFNPKDENQWRSFQPGQQYDIQVNGLDIPDWNSLKSAGAQ